MIAQSSIDLVIDRSDIVEVIGQFVRLRRRGVNHIGNCPFHNEKTPSFNVNPSRGIFKCFGCGKAGNVITFLEEHEKLTFPEAIRWLADYYHIEIEETETSESQKAQQQVEESLRIINQFAAEYFQKTLWENEEGQLIGLSYFKERGFSDETIKTFQLGYSLDGWENFAQHALQQGFKPELLVSAGLIKSRENNTFYDSYRGRVIFPIFGNTGNVLGFGARILKQTDKAPKYVNTPENELYNKSKILYGLYQARQQISRENECFLVEGYTDVISLYQGGMQNVVASSGTSLTTGQLKLIGNLTKNLTILYDGDAAGIKAALRGLDMALSESFNVKVVLLPQGEDPDSFMKQNGAQYFKNYIEEHKQGVIPFRLSLGLNDAGTDPQKRAQLVNEIAETISKIDKIEDFTLQQDYIRESAQKLQIEEQGLVNLVNKFIRERLQKEQREKQQELQRSDDVEAPPVSEEYTPAETPTTLLQLHQEEWQIIKVLLNFGHLPFENTTVAQFLLDTIDYLSFEDELARLIIQEYEHYLINHHRCPDLKLFSYHQNAQIANKAATLLQVPYEPSHNWKDLHKIDVVHGEQLYKEEVKSTLAYYELKLLRASMQENIRMMQSCKDTQEIQTRLKTHLTLKQRERELMEIVIVR